MPKAKFLLEDIFTITGRGTVFSGRIMDNGIINIGDIVILGDKLAPIRGIEAFRRAFDSTKGVASYGDNVGILVGGGITKEEAIPFRKQELVITDRTHIRQDKLDQLGI